MHLMSPFWRESPFPACKLLHHHHHRNFLLVVMLVIALFVNTFVAASEDREPRQCEYDFDCKSLV